jgi:hypothetical protein
MFPLMFRYIDQLTEQEMKPVFHFKLAEEVIIPVLWLSETVCE